jgi:hypothetical protein
MARRSALCTQCSTSHQTPASRFHPVELTSAAPIRPRLPTHAAAPVATAFRSNYSSLLLPASRHGPSTPSPCKLSRHPTATSPPVHAHVAALAEHSHTAASALAQIVRMLLALQRINTLPRLLRRCSRAGSPPCGAPSRPRCQPSECWQPSAPAHRKGQHHAMAHTANQGQKQPSRCEPLCTLGNLKQDELGCT